MIKRSRLAGLMSPIPGSTTQEQAASLLVGCFEYADLDYFVRPTGAHGRWDVVKCASDGQALVEHRVTRDGKVMVCDCRAGSKHLACRHKEMVQMFVDGRDEGVPGTKPVTPSRQQARPTPAQVKFDRRAIKELLERTERLLEKTDAR